MIVTRQQLDGLHDQLRATTADPQQGVFGPSSAMWRVGREAALFLGGGRALLLQLAHPFVAHAVAQHSHLKTDPLGRFKRTFEGVFGMTFGDLDSAIDRSCAVHAVHAAIHGPITESDTDTPGARYHANDPAALLWVHATLVDTMVQIHDLVLGPMTPAEREDLYRDTRRAATLFGLDDGAVPRDWTAFAAYMRGMLDGPTLRVGDTARELASYLFHGRGALRRPLFRAVEAVTTGLLPPRLRDAFGLRFGLADRALFRTTLLGARAAHPFLPAHLRYAPAYMHAQRRLQGKAGPDRVARVVEQLTGRLVA